MNFLIRKFKNALIAFINSEQNIPIEVKRMILSEILKMVEDKANIICNEEENIIMEESKNELLAKELGERAERSDTDERGKP